MIWTLKVGWTKSKALFWHLSGGTEESHEPHPQPGQPTSRSEPTNFTIQSTNCNVQCIHTNYGMCTHSYKKKKKKKNTPTKKINKLL